jgi:hypothetical protein
VCAINSQKRKNQLQHKSSFLLVLCVMGFVY